MTLLKQLTTRIAKFFSKVPLQTVLIVPFMLQILVTVGITGWLSFLSGQESVNNVASKLRHEISARIEQKIISYLEKPHIINQNNIDAFRLGLLSLQNSTQLEHHFWQQMQLFQSVSYIAIGTPQGDYIGVERLDSGMLQIKIANQSTQGAINTYAVSDQGDRLQLLSRKPNYDPRNRGFYQTAVKAGKARWTEIYTLFIEPKLSISAVQPIYTKENKFLGVMATDLILTQIGNFLDRQKIGQSGQAFILERNGLLVASSTSEKPFVKIGSQQKRLEAIHSSDPVTRATAIYLSEHFGNLSRINQAQETDFTKGQQKYMLYISPLKDDYGIDWLTVIVLPESDFTAQIQASVRTTLLLCLLALAVAIAFGIVTSRWIAYPILRLSKAAAEISAGRWETTVFVEQPSFAEVKVLAQAFRHTVMQLQNSMTNLEQRQISLENTKDKLQIVLQAVPGIVSWVSADLRYLSVNRHLADIYNLSPEDFVGKDIGFLGASNEFQEFMRQFFASSEQEYTKEISAEVNGKSMHYLIVAQKYDQDRAAFTVGVDITQRKQAEETVRYQALHDLLTDLPNRILFNQKLEEALVRADQDHHLIAVMFIDLDRFKTINDSLGHAAGDRFLQAVVKRLTQSCLEPNCMLARWSGDEFTLLIPLMNSFEEAIEVAETLLEKLLPPFSLDEYTIHTSGSIGIAIYPMDGKDSQTLIKNADAAMYHAKKKGRNNYQLYHQTMNSLAVELLDLETALHKAIKDHEFVIHYQPKVDISTHAVVGVEALIRWQHPEQGLVPPDLFIPLAEENGLIIPLAEWVLWTACTQAKSWQNKGLSSLRVAVNISARQFLQPNLLQIVTEVLAGTGLEPQYLELEITESLAMQDIDFTRSILSELYKQGVRIVIDDFGTGYSSLSYLKNFPIHALKVDKSFVQNVLSDRYDQAIMKAVVALGHGLDLDVVVEGAETKEQVDYLRSLNCDEVQGKYFSSALDTESATKYLIENSGSHTDVPLFYGDSSQKR